MAKDKLTFRKVKSAKTSNCFYCNKLTDSILTLKDHSEVWCCLDCEKSHSKIKKFVKGIDKCLDSTKQTILDLDLRSGFQTKSIVGGNYGKYN